MVIKMVSIQVTREIYNRILKEFDGRKFGTHNGLNIGLYRNMQGRYFIQSSDNIDKIIK